MTIIINLVMLSIVAFSAHAGTRRGFVLIGLELLSFIIATTAALLGYHTAGLWLHALPGFTLALGNVGAFMLIWILTEITCAVIVRFLLLPRIAPHLHRTRPSQISGAVLNAAKSLITICLSLVVFAGLPISAGTKQAVTSSALPKLLLAYSGNVQNWFNGGLGSDLSQSLNFFTVPDDPESTERINLGFTATGQPDPGDEAAMLALVNHERTSRGIPALVMNQQARVEARAYSQTMLLEGYFSHIDNSGHNPFDRMRAAHIKFDIAGENLALAPTLALAHQGLMNSPGHRANILNPAYRTVGIGIENAGPYGLMVTQDFTD